MHSSQGKYTNLCGKDVHQLPLILRLVNDEVSTSNTSLKRFAYALLTHFANANMGIAFRTGLEFLYPHESNSIQKELAAQLPTADFRSPFI
jgi:hypothetical protein